MFFIGDKLEIIPKNSIIEVVSIYPGGQTTKKEDEYKICIEGVAYQLPFSLLNLLFKKVGDAQPFFVAVPEEKEVESPDPIVEPEEEEKPKEEEKKRPGRPKKE